jgi:uncharacterized membrane protein YgdD (TMEM256/DUF423 family)
MESTNNIVIYTPIEKALFLDGGFMFVLAFIVAGALAAVVMAQIDKRVRRFSFLHNNMMWVGGAVFVGSLFLMHLANVKGWL